MVAAVARGPFSAIRAFELVNKNIRAFDRDVPAILGTIQPLLAIVVNRPPFDSQRLSMGRALRFRDLPKSQMIGAPISTFHFVTTNENIGLRRPLFGLQSKLDGALR